MLYRYLLIVRFALINTVAVGLMAGAYLQGWLDVVISAYLVELSVVIFLVFLYGLVLCGAKDQPANASARRRRAPRPRR